MRHEKPPHDVECYIGLGSNLDNPAARLDAALVALDTIPDTNLVRHSSYYRSKPLGPSGQPDYLNAAALLACSLPAPQLLRQLQDIENHQGRVRNGPRWGPRTLDLDILLYGNEIIDEPELVVPHPQIKYRNFVLMPLLELAPGLDLPGLGRAAEWLARVGTAGITKL
ncbi:MAG: 2-amino-4-hydroxy-6-hydroxymethyldihydropteridine diphosphokinase [Gammaproteobacteria bacterium]|nr:2-amino-4-hydroxy-6-hydroxymethyldihydropteridine diphosphokinase [Gammaproteobacteria bacterium]MCY4337608.1 2-amino-4-hydroxy-6-hydroxymethyldihydropteridine diphosphokinase [Gammaproteobacteria bacterium]